MFPGLDAHESSWDAVQPRPIGGRVHVIQACVHVIRPCARRSPSRFLDIVYIDQLLPAPSLSYHVRRLSADLSDRAASGTDQSALSRLTMSAACEAKLRRRAPSSCRRRQPSPRRLAALDGTPSGEGAPCTGSSSGSPPSPSTTRSPRRSEKQHEGVRPRSRHSPHRPTARRTPAARRRADLGRPRRQRRGGADRPGPRLPSSPSPKTRGCVEQRGASAGNGVWREGANCHRRRPSTRSTSQLYR